MQLNQQQTTEVHRELILFGLDPQDWSLDALPRDQILIKNKKDKTFQMLGLLTESRGELLLSEMQILEND